MKKNFLLSYFIIAFILPGLVFQLNGQGVAINEDGSQPHPSSLLEISRSKKELLLPRRWRSNRITKLTHRRYKPQKKR